MRVLFKHGLVKGASRESIGITVVTHAQRHISRLIRIGRSQNCSFGIDRRTAVKTTEVDDARIYREAKEGGVNVVRRFVEEVKGYVSRAGGG
jgi:hypothetical protein